MFSESSQRLFLIRSVTTRVSTPSQHSACPGCFLLRSSPRPTMSFPDAVRKVFDSLDTDKSGKISVAELKKALEGECGHALKEEDVKAFVARLDKNKDGELSIDELNALFQ
ncbi:hypothetical protein SprV_0301049300 [Sparganum proliferum]